jgi:hypothetical protein
MNDKYESIWKELGRGLMEVLIALPKEVTRGRETSGKAEFRAEDLRITRMNRYLETNVVCGKPLIERLFGGLEDI